MKTLTEWKARLQPGTRIQQVHNGYEGRCEHWLTITELQSNGAWATRDDTGRRGFLDFPKRADIEFTENGWKRFAGGKLLSEYIWL